MKRRKFVMLFSGIAAVLPLVAHAQQPVIGFLRSTSSVGTQHLVAAFHQGLAETGYVEGTNVSVEYRWANGDVARLPELATDLVTRQVAVIVANGVAVKPAIAATSTIPIVFVVGIDPVRSGLVGSLNRPSANVTGVSIVSIDLDAKRLAILHELVPKASTIAVLLDPNVVETDLSTRAVQTAAEAIGQQVVIVRAGSEHEFDAAFSTIVQSRAGALLVGGGAFFVTQRRRIVDLATRHSLPAIYMTRDSVDVGGLISYGPSQVNAYRRAGGYVGRILKGTKPTELPVELPTRYQLVINLKTAKALGIAVPPTLLALADEVIE